MSNPSGISPLRYIVLIRLDKVEERTAGGIILTDEKRDREQGRAMKGELIACSPFAFGYEAWPEDMERPKAGDRVMVARMAGVEAKGLDGEDYRLVKDEDVLAVLG